MIVFTVADTGVGIAVEDQERIFQEFQQVENPLQRRSHGTGLGLPLSQKLARFLGGELSVRSEVGSGAAFTAVIPRTYTERRAAVPGRAAAPPPDDLTGSGVPNE
jgi:signal transduction histidine kinase